MWLIAFVGMLPIFPQIFVWGSCFWLGTPVRVPSVRRLPSLTHNSLTHNSLTHNSLTHSPITHSPITHNLLTHNSPTHKLCVAGVPLMALGWLWWRAWFPFLAAAVCLAGVALGSIHILCGKRGTWRHRPSLCGRRGNFGTGLALVARLVPVVAAAVCRIWTHRPPFSVVGAALGDIGIHFVWQAWHLWHWAGSGGALGCSCFWKNRPPFCVAGLALGDIGLHFVWQAWRLWYCADPLIR